MALSLAENPPESFLPGYAQSSTAELVPSISKISPGWMVAQTRTRMEKQLAGFLEFHGIPYFLPYSRSWASSPENRNRTTRNRTLVPMFDGFVFVAGRIPQNANQPGFDYRFSRSPLDRDLLLSITKDVCYGSGMVFKFLHSQNQPRLAAELAQLASLSPESRRTASEEDRIASLRAGQPVIVRGGPFAGMEGAVSALELANPMANGGGLVKMVVDLHLMGRKVAVEVDRDYLDPVADPCPEGAA
jgi:transcription antitermination factor NusG